MSQALREARDRAEKDLLALADIAEERQLTDEENATVEELKASLVDIRKREEIAAEAASLRAAAADRAKATAEEQSELRSAARQATGPQRVDVRARSAYDAENRTVSFFKDIATLQLDGASNAEVEEARGRLESHYEATSDDASGRQIRTYSAGTSSQGGYLVAPQYLQEAFADLLTAGRPTADLVGKMAMPNAGKTFYIPGQDGATAVSEATENSSLAETAASFTQIQIDATRIGGAATMPNWLVDRSFPGADQIVLRDLAKQYAVKVDNIVLNSSTNNRKGLLQESNLGASTANASTPTIATIWPAVLNAVQDVVTGVFSYPDAIVMHPRRWAWLAAQLDKNDRPVLGSLNPYNAVGAFDGANNTGQFAGPVPSGSLLGIPVYLDANIPTNLGSGTNEDRIIVMRKSEPILMESAPKFAVSMDAQFANDQLVARVTGDVAFTCARRKGAVSVINGTALAATI